MPNHIYITPEQYDKAAEIGICRNVLNNRVRRCKWDIEKAITTPLQRQGALVKNMELAKKNGIGESTFRTRVYRLGWSYEEAATKPVNEKYRRID